MLMQARGLEPRFIASSSGKHEQRVIASIHDQHGLAPVIGQAHSIDGAAYYQL